MNKKLKDPEELDKTIKKIAEEVEESHDFFEHIRQFNFGVKDILRTIDVKKYDELSKDYNSVDFYISLRKRIEILDSIEYAKHIEKEMYDDEFSDESTGFILERDEESEPMSEEDFNEYKNSRIYSELKDTVDHLVEIFYGDALKLKKVDIKFLGRADLMAPIKAIDMPHIAFLNRYAGFMGGMKNNNYNKIIGDTLLESASIEVLKKGREIPKGYGWESDGLFKKTVWCEVDLNASDDILVEAFKNWLPQAREMHREFFDTEPSNVKSNFKKSLLKKWKDLRVLAYLDMKILADYFHQSPTYTQYANYLYFDDFDIDTTEKVRKTLIPAVKDIYVGDCLEDLVRQIHAENRIF